MNRVRVEQFLYTLNQVVDLFCIASGGAHPTQAEFSAIQARVYTHKNQQLPHNNHKDRNYEVNTINDYFFLNFCW